MAERIGKKNTRRYVASHAVLSSGIPQVSCHGPDSAVGGPGQGRYASPVASSAPRSNSPGNLQGRLLLADPSLRDDGTFHRSVILLTDHRADEGSSGVILNQPTGRVVGDYLPDKVFEPLRQVAVHKGGPVTPDQLTFIAFWWHPKTGLCWENRISHESAIHHTHRLGTLVRAFVGYSGWAAGQLEQELKGQSWIVADAPPSLLGLDHSPPLWADLLRSLSPLHRILAEAPDDPFLN